MLSELVFLILNKKWRLRGTVPESSEPRVWCREGSPETLAQLTPSTFSCCGFGEVEPKAGVKVGDEWQSKG